MESAFRLNCDLRGGGGGSFSRPSSGFISFIHRMLLARVCWSACWNDLTPPPVKNFLRTALSFLHLCKKINSLHCLSNPMQMFSHLVKTGLHYQKCKPVFTKCENVCDHRGNFQQVWRICKRSLREMKHWISSLKYFLQTLQNLICDHRNFDSVN